jgi:chromosome segregation ATPase
VSGVISLEDLSQRITKVETKVEEHQRLLNAQTEKNDSLTRLTILMERQQEESKEFKSSLNKFNDTLDKVNENLTNLNLNQHNLNLTQQQMKDDMTEIGSRVTEIERNQDENKIDTIKLIKAILSYVATGIGSIAIAYLLYKFGISGGIQH